MENNCYLPTSRVLSHTRSKLVQFSKVLPQEKRRAAAVSTTASLTAGAGCAHSYTIAHPTTPGYQMYKGNQQCLCSAAETLDKDCELEY